jgi:protein TonB
MQFYAMSHRIQYLAEDNVTPPGVLLEPEALFQWEQRRTVLDARVLALAFTVGEDGKAQNISIVSPVGMGLDDDTVQALTEWRFKPGIREGKPCPVHARVVFEINAPNARPIPR